jgi:hypothetical protein
MVLTVWEFNTSFSKDIKEHFDNQSREAVKNSAFSKIYDVSDTSEYTASYISTEWVDLPAYFDEWEDLKNSSIGKGYKVTYDSAEFGHIMAITKKARLKVGDSSEKIAKIANKQKNSAIIAMNTFLEKEMWSLLNYTNATNASYKILAPDLKPLISTTHTWNSTKTTFDNNLSTSAISVAHAAAVVAKGAAFVDSHGTPMPLDFNTIYVKEGGAASKQALQVYASRNAQGQYQVTDLANINIYSGTVSVVEVPWMTSGNDYFYVADSEMLGLENPLFVEFIQRPQAEWVFKENANLTWEMPYSGSFKYGIKNLPFTILGGKVA